MINKEDIEKAKEFFELVSDLKFDGPVSKAVKMVRALEWFARTIKAAEGPPIKVLDKEGIKDGKDSGGQGQVRSGDLGGSKGGLATGAKGQSGKPKKGI